MDTLKKFLSAPQVETFSPAAAAELKAFQTKTGLSLPSSLQQLYMMSNGLKVDDLGLTFLPLSRVMEYIVGIKNFGITQRWGYFPFTDANNSNPHCVCCHPPLSGRIVLVCHDDEATLDFRDLESFLQAILTLIGDDDDHIIDDLPAQYDNGSDRTPQDLADGFKLLELASGIPKEDIDRDQSFIFGIRLLSDANIEKFAELLEAGSHVRYAALNRLQQIPTDEVRSILTAYHKSVDQFRTDAVASLRRAGITVEEIQDNNVLIQPNNVWFNLDAFYARRKEPDTFTRLLNRANKLISQKSK